MHVVVKFGHFKCLQSRH